MEDGQRRAHGQPASEEIAHELGRDLVAPVTDSEVSEPLDLTRSFRRMRTDWNSKDREIIDEVEDAVEIFIFNQFGEAFGIEYEIWNIVRDKVIDPETGEIMQDANGLDLWAKRDDGSYIEDWTRMNSYQRERLLYQIITRLFTWERTVAKIKGQAMFAKAIWEEAFATGFDTAPEGKKTEAARTAVGNRVSADYRYLAVYKSMVLEQAQAIVRSMDRICQRLKDLHV